MVGGPHEHRDDGGSVFWTVTLAVIVAGLGWVQPLAAVAALAIITGIGVFLTEQEHDRWLKRPGYPLSTVTVWLNLGEAGLTAVVAAFVGLLCFGGSDEAARVAGLVSFVVSAAAGHLLYRFAYTRGYRVELWGFLKGATACGVAYAVVYKIIGPRWGIVELINVIVRVRIPDKLTEAVDLLRAGMGVVDAAIEKVLSFIVGNMLAWMITLAVSANVSIGLASIGVVWFAWQVSRAVTGGNSGTG